MQMLTKRQISAYPTPAKTQEELNREYDRCIERLEDARQAFLQLDAVIGVGYGPKEKGGQVNEDEPCLIVYVEEKKDNATLSANELIPAEYNGVLTDVVVPGKRAVPHHNEYDSMWLDWGNIHARNPHAEINLEPMIDYDLDQVAILDIDDTFVTTNNKIDWPKATKRFLNSHPDAFDFITFFVDTSTGLPGQGSFHSGIYNKTTGINYYAGANLDNRNTFGSQKLQAMHSISFFGNYVLLQETGHMWGAFVRNRDTQAGPNQYDLLIGPTGQGKFHWGRFFDNQHSPMDYDGIDWQALAGNRFQPHGVQDNQFHYCPLDLYLMGLIPPSQVGSYYVITNPSGNSGIITGGKKNLAVQNVTWAEGNRNPAYPNAQKIWKQAFVVLTKNARASRGFAQQVAQQRRAFTWEFYKGTRFLGKADTTLRASTLFPQIRDISISVDNDRAIIGWKTNVSTRGRVNFGTTSAAFRREQAHTNPFSTVADPAFKTSHGLLLTGLTPNTTYYFEVIAETAEGLFDREGVEQLYTRKTNDACAPDINNVSVRRSGSVRNKVVVSWKTNEPSDSRVYYGATTPPAQQKHDAYPTTNHSTVLTGLSGGSTYFISMESRDAAGNVTRDDNNGAYHRVLIPLSAESNLESVSEGDIAKRIEKINDAIKTGIMDSAIEQTSHFISNVATEEITHIAQNMTLPEDDLEAGYAALEELVRRLGGTLQVVEQNADFIDIGAEVDPLCNISCINLPGDTVAQECGHPVLSEVISKVFPRLTLEPDPTPGMGHYRLQRV